MTKSELLKLNNVDVEIGSHVTLTAYDGYKITEWEYGNDISTFSCFSKVYMAVRKDYPNYRVLTKDEAERLQSEYDALLLKDLEYGKSDNQ
jgi:hypothetical protein